MKYTIEVSQQDIDNGICGNAKRCAVALAIQRITGKEIWVYPNKIYWNYKNQLIPILNYNEMKTLSKWLDEFDVNKKKVKPICFELDVNITI